MSARVELRLCGSMDHLRISWQTGETLLESIPFADDPEGTRYNILVALQEMITNILRHGYEHDEQHPVELCFDVDQAGIQVELRDQGPAFDPTEVTPTMLDDTSMPIAEGGYGIMIAKMVMDELTYQREGDWNVLRMQKAAAPAAVRG
ncbi:MAG: ATP-binding protein [Planctomycetota bacterium]